MISQRLRPVLLGLFGLTLLSAVLSYGAVETVSLAFSSLLVHICLFLSVLTCGLPAATRGAVWTAFGVLGAVSLWVALQTLPLPGEFLANAVWREVQGFPAPVISISPMDDRIALLKVFLPLSTFILSLVLFDTDKRALWSLKALVIVAALLAGALLAQHVVSPNSLLFGPKRAYLDSFTGPFVNRNTAATFFATAALLSLALFFRRASRIDWAAVRSALADGVSLPLPVSATMRRAVLHGLFSVQLIVALALTKSRAGIACFAFALVAYIALRYLGQRRGRSSSSDSDAPRRENWRVFIGILALLAMGALLSSVLFGQVLYRAEISTRPEERFCMLPAILAALIDHMPLGAGLASFRPLFPAYRDPACGIVYVWDMAHNLYLEGTLALGILFPVLLATVVAVLFLTFRRGRRYRQRYRFAPDLGLALMLLVLAHSAVDFSLQIPGFAAYFAACLAPLVTLSSGGGSRRQSQSSA